MKTAKSEDVRKLGRIASGWGGNLKEFEGKGGERESRERITSKFILQRKLKQGMILQSATGMILVFPPRCPTGFYGLTPCRNEGGNPTFKSGKIFSFFPFLWPKHSDPVLLSKVQLGAACCGFSIAALIAVTKTRVAMETSWSGVDLTCWPTGQ